MAKDKNIKMTRKDLSDSRYTYGIDRKYKVDRPSINKDYNYKKKISELQKRGEKSDDKK